MANKIDIPNGWEVKKLGEIGNFLKGKGIKKDEFIKAILTSVRRNV